VIDLCSRRLVDWSIAGHNDPADQRRPSDHDALLGVEGVA
jgi:hypothetical protein